MDSGSDQEQTASRLVEVTLDEASIRRTTPDVDHERKVAIFDLLEENSFHLAEGEAGPYCLNLSLAENRLVFAVASETKAPITTFMLSLSPFRKIVKDYFLVCESYYEAIKTAPPSRIEALDMGRRGLHDEGSRLLAERLKGKIEVDFPTARRLFTLICVLHWKG
ncbi:MAG: UPF0262 family protein [Hyphomicrobiales bacterium]|nr:UPF0262 family protein [Hyphomicrobiales bacterium]